MFSVNCMQSRGLYPSYDNHVKSYLVQSGSLNTYHRLLTLFMCCTDQRSYTVCRSLFTVIIMFVIFPPPSVGEGITISQARIPTMRALYGRGINSQAFSLHMKRPQIDWSGNLVSGLLRQKINPSIFQKHHLTHRNYMSLWRKSWDSRDYSLGSGNDISYTTTM